MKQLSLQRPLIILDLETTDLNPATARIIEISILRMNIGGGQEKKTYRINPMCAISPEATTVHGISNDDVCDEPPFGQVADELFQLLQGADLVGFNLLAFDLPILISEFQRAGRELRVSDRRLIDVMRIFHKKEPRDLRRAVEFYLAREHTEAHSAEADVAATAEVLEAQLQRYSDLPKTVDGLDKLSRGDDVDLSGRFVRRGGEVVFNFGKHSGRLLMEVACADPDYLAWALGQDFPQDAMDLMSDALREAKTEAEASSPMSRAERLVEELRRKG